METLFCNWRETERYWCWSKKKTPAGIWCVCYLFTVECPDLQLRRKLLCGEMAQVIRAVLLSHKLTSRGLWSPISCGLPHLVVSHILWSPTSCGLPHFVVSHILWSPISCGLPYLVVSHILWSPISCGLPYLVVSHILWSPISCGLPYLNPCDYDLWFILKAGIYVNNPQFP
jgi:hypothetical protein